MENKLQSLPILVYEELPTQLYQPFAWGDTFLRLVNKNPDHIILHIWPMENTVILGMLDRRLPNCDEAIKEVRAHGYRAVVRNVGGLAVVADSGVLNFSFIIPKNKDEKFSIQEAYLLMTNFIREMFKEYGKSIEHFLVEHSYCPGDFDLSINGKKFAGIAQRRFKDGVSISIYLSVTGDQKKRGELIRKFYDKGMEHSGFNEKFYKSPIDFPIVEHHTMANLSDLLNTKLNVKLVIEKLLKTLHSMNRHINNLVVDNDLQQEFEQFYNKIIDRNRKV